MSSRIRALFFLHAATNSARLFGPLIGLILMQDYLWSPFTIVIVALFIKYMLLSFFPETSPYFKSYDDQRSEAREYDATHSIYLVIRSIDLKCLKSKVN